MTIPFKVVARDDAPFAVTLQGADLLAPILTSAGGYRDAAAAAASAAAASAQAAALAEDGALSAANIYADTTAGLAATTSGEYFWVVGSGATIVAVLYLNDGGVAEEQKRNVIQNSVLLYGADPTGLTDSTAAFEAAQLAADFVYVPPGDYTLEEFAIGTGKHFYSEGANIIPGSTSAAAITATNADGWSLRGHWTITGPYTPTTYASTAELYVAVDARPSSGTGIGINIEVCRNWLIENLTIVGINGSGVKFTGGLNYYPRTYGKLINPNISWCSIGIETVPDDTAAEYLTIDNPVLAQNRTGIRVAIGNIEVNGGQIVDNEIGVDLVGEASAGVPANNHAHGMFTGVQINHNYGRNVNAKSILNGHTFVSCHFYGDPPSVGYPLGQGLIVLNNCKGINFVGGIMASPIYPLASAPLLIARNTIRDMWIPDASVVGPFYDGNTEGDAARAQMMFIGNRTATGSWSGNQPMEVVTNASRTSTNQSITAATPVDVIFNNVVQDRQSLASIGADPSYDNTTGVFTAPSTGWYDIESLMRIVSDTGTFTGGDVFIKVVSSGTTYTIVNPLVKVSTTEARTRTAARLFLAATAEVNLTVSVAATNPAVETGSTLQITMRA
jgi:hypothetical protein